MFRKSLVFLPYYCLLWAYTEAYTPPPRAYIGCAILQDKLYCYGGGTTAADGVNLRTVNDHVYIDLSASFAIANGSSTWQKVPPPSGFELEPNAMFAYAPISNTSYMITAGYGSGPNTTLVNMTTIYDAKTNQWESVPGKPFDQTVGSSLTMDSNNVAWFWGGAQSVLSTTAPSATMFRYSQISNQWTSLTSSLPSTITTGYAFHAAAFAQNKIYLIGGESQGFVSMSNILVFDTVAQSWSLLSIPNSISPPREKMTLTYLPATNQLLMYGGVYVIYNTYNVVSDNLAWLYDVNANTWENKTIPGNSPGPRYAHSATLYLDRYLFISFGTNAANVDQNDVHALDTQNWQWLDTWTPVKLNSNSNGSPKNTQTPSNTYKPNSLSAGGIAGIAVGAAVLIIGAAVGIFFFVRRKRRAEKGRPEDDGFLYDQKKGHDSSNQPNDQPPPPIYDGSAKPMLEMNKPDSNDNFDGYISKPDDATSVPHYVLQPVKPDDVVETKASTTSR